MSMRRFTTPVLTEINALKIIAPFGPGELGFRAVCRLWQNSPGTFVTDYVQRGSVLANYSRFRPGDRRRDFTMMDSRLITLDSNATSMDGHPVARATYVSAVVSIGLTNSTAGE